MPSESTYAVLIGYFLKYPLYAFAVYFAKEKKVYETGKDSIMSLSF